MTNRTEKLLIAMSGGVDSAIAAKLCVDAGFDCQGVTLRFYRPGEEGTACSCCDRQEIEDARKVTGKLGIPFRVLDYTADFESEIIGKFIRTYEAGGTPNPCVDCNRTMKFGKLMEYALSQGMDCVVTGHYARVEYDAQRGRWLLKKALDESKDQSYVLYSLTQEQLAHTRFPLGTWTKKQVRELAEQAGLENARKQDSQDICFVPDGDYAAFMEQYTGKHYPPGPFLDINGAVVGTHRGAVRYTLGQRKGLGLAMGEPVYVCGKDMEKNTVTVGPESLLFAREIWAEDMNWIAIPELTEPMRVEAKARYRHRQQPAIVYPEAGGRVRLVFDEPQRAVTPGQALLLYDGDIVVGGGTIIGTEENIHGK